MKITDMVYYSPMEKTASRNLDQPGRRLMRCYILIFLAALLTLAWQLIFPGYYNKIIEDAAYTHKYIVQFMESFKEGVIYPRWLPDNFKGYGTPVFVFYSPLLYFCSALLGLAGLALPLSVIFLKLAGLFTGGLFLFLLAKKHFGERAALLAALLYILLPTRILFLYHINTPAGRFGEAFMPMSLYFMHRYMEGGARRLHLAGLAFSYAALILSHIATAYLFTPFLAAYGLIAHKGSLPRAAPRVALGLASGILLSSFFFMPVLFERGLVQLDFLARYPIMENFVFKISGAVSFGKTGPLGPIVLNTFIYEPIMAVVFLFIARRQGGLPSSAVAVFMMVSAAVCVFMMSSLSYLIWKYAPGMHAEAFPGRFTPVYIIFISMLLGTGLDSLLRLHARAFTAVVVSLVLTVLAYDALLVVKSMPPVSEADAVKIAEEHEMLEYLPATVDQQALPMLKKDDPLVSYPDGHSAEIKKWDFTGRAFLVDSPRGARLRVKTFYFPGWRAWVDGKEAPLTAQEKTGVILMDVPPGRHDVELKFTDTPPRTAGKILSLLTVVALLLPSCTFFRTRKKVPKKAGP